jgi:hypothetical protein
MLQALSGSTFHVKHSLAEAEASEQRVEEILDAGPSGKPIKCSPRPPKLLSG